MFKNVKLCRFIAEMRNQGSCFQINNTLLKGVNGKQCYFLF